MSIYQTKQGDTFDGIVFNLYGDRRYTKELMEVNPAYLEVIIFSGGISLNLPEIVKTDNSITNLPPWRD